MERFRLFFWQWHRTKWSTACDFCICGPTSEQVFRGKRLVCLKHALD